MRRFIGMKAARNGRRDDRALSDLHHRILACTTTLCGVDKAVRNQPACALAVTHTKTLWAIFKRAWTSKDEQPQREQYRYLLAAEVNEPRETRQRLT